MNPVRELRRKVSITQAELAEAAGTSQPTIAAYESGRKSPTLGTITRMARSVGLEASVSYDPSMTREERRSLILHRAIARRLLDDPVSVVATAKKNLRRMRSRIGSTQLLKEWAVILGRPVSALLPVLTDTGVWARELRHVTPFAGILRHVERAFIYAEFAANERLAS